MKKNNTPSHKTVEVKKTGRNSAQILRSIEKLLQIQNSKLERIDRKLADIKLRLGANY